MIYETKDKALIGVGWYRSRYGRLGHVQEARDEYGPVRALCGRELELCINDSGATRCTGCAQRVIELGGGEL